MKTYPLRSAQVFHLAGLAQIVFLFFLWPLANPCFGDRAPSTNTIPWNDDFENQYTNLTPLIGGTNGWYASSSDVVVQTNTVRSGTSAAKIPMDCTLSNLFSNAPPTNVWIQMDVRPSLYDSTNSPVVDTNAAAMFYVNTNGNFVVHNGLATNTAGVPDPTNSVNWVVVTNMAIATNGTTWVRVNIYQDFANTNWCLYADGVLATNNIGLINPNRTNFTGFDIYNGATTSYLDNASVVAAVTSSCPPLIVVPSSLSQSNLYARATLSQVPSPQTVSVINVWSTDIGFQVRTNQYWVTASLTNGMVTPGTTQDVVLTYADTIGWGAGVSNATVTVVATNGTAYWGTQTVQVALNLIDITNSLYVTPTWFSNDVWLGATPTNRTFNVQNLADLDFTYTVTTNIFWIASSSNAGVLTAYGTNTLILTNTVSTLGWAPGTTSNAIVTVTATNVASGVSAVQTVNVAVNVLNISNVLEVIPMTLTSTVWTGDAPTNRTFVVSNKSDVSFVYNVTTGATWITNSLPGGTLAARSSVMGTLTYGKTVNWVLPGSNSWVKVATSDGDGATQELAVTVNIINFDEGTLQVAPQYLTNTAWIGDTPTSQSFQVWNTGDLSFVYGVTTTRWIAAASPTGGTLAAHSTSSTNTVTLTYRPTWDFAVGTTNATAIVSSVNGYGLTQNVAVTLIVTSPALNYYVATNMGNVWPYTNWATAASNLTSAVYKANCYTNVRTVVWISNGLYNLTAEVAVSNVTVRSVNGPESVTLNGTNNRRGFHLSHTGAVLNGLTITNCTAGRGTNGGAVFVSTGLVWNCQLLKNAATNGGGVAVGNGGVVRDCLIWWNTATNGGGVYYVNGCNGLVESCTIASNLALRIGGGLYTATSTTGLCENAVVYQNSAGSYSNWGTNSAARLLFTNCCVSPTDEVYGLNNIDSDPLFVNVTTGNCRLRWGSPCFNKGTNQNWMVNEFDLAGSIRVRFGWVDIGAYEWYPYQGIKINGVPYEKIKFINGTEPLKINDIRNSSP